MRKYKIVEMVDGHGNKKFQIKEKYGWGLFSFWENRGGQHNSLKYAQNDVEVHIKNNKSEQRFKVKEYLYTDVPNHIPEEQVSKFMELNDGRKR